MIPRKLQINYKNKVQVTEIVSDSIYFEEYLDKDGNNLSNGNTFIVSRENFSNFREVFANFKALQFKNGEFLKILNFKSSDHLDGPHYYESLQNKDLSITLKKAHFIFTAITRYLLVISNIY